MQAFGQVGDEGVSFIPTTKADNNKPGMTLANAIKCQLAVSKVHIICHKCGMKGH